MSFNLYLNSNSNENFVGMHTFFNEITSIKGSQHRFKYIEESPIKTQMDIFFLCLLIGFKKNVKENTKNYKSNEFSGNYIDTYQNFSDLINGFYLAIKVEKELGENANKSSVRELIKKLINPQDKINDLNTGALAELNSFALGGYIEILKKFDYKKPEDVSVFFNKYIELLS